MLVAWLAKNRLPCVPATAFERRPHIHTGVLVEFSSFRISVQVLSNGRFQTALYRDGVQVDDEASEYYGPKGHDTLEGLCEHLKEMNFHAAP